MTRSSSSQQTPASPEARTESGAEGEGTAVNSAAGAAPVASAASAVPDTAAAPGTAPGTAPAPAPDSAPARAESEAAAASKTSKTSKGEASGEPQSSEGEESAAPKSPEAAAPAAGTSGAAPAPDSDPDPSASAAAQSRLPALVRTMSATAIGQPQQEAGPVGRPGKAALAGAAVVGALLVSVPFLVLAGNNDDGPRQTNTAAAGTVLDGSGPEAPGEFAVTAPETSAAAEDEKGKKGDEGAAEKAGNAVPAIPPPAAPSGGDKDAPKKEADSEAPPKKKAAPEAEPKKADSPKAQPKKDTGGAKAKPAKAQPAVTFSGPVSFRSHLSGRCLDVPGHNFNDGQPLFMWDCNGAEAQQWRFGSDGTIRAKDKCLDVANANFNNGTPIQLAWCNGSAAQKFTLNGAHDLVNTVVGKCVDIPNHSKSRGPSTYLILWECTGNDNQKWST
ncbi:MULTISPECIES: ricin-type beta-trefoil lectin domain protein [Streptomyces]|uniref:Ricin-type beta-trefoil lectin domain protein n=1 Tax=Streptomyces cyaneofuscatus TaxID=66883 RepID=A0ABZ1F3E0_9ACTN|nr:ricin-type beta-trefoil lectin domain protein [Streptomyces cyaneofuscatus]WSB10930.1 ricin-type beta-trefoil lectin domain protein [Streptomyces cyaneofuscatus]WSD45537.1 ricin-type beta-trefoil lectin domain protein [Streptomyces cyaneofuscatus]